MSAAARLRIRMTNSKAGWSPDDLDRLYRGFGFEVREGEKPRIYTHPAYPCLRATVTRSRTLATGQIETALELLKRLDAQTAQAEEEAK